MKIRISRDRRRAMLGALACGLAAVIPMTYVWGFTVDDALVTARVAHQLACGRGYRFNPAGPAVDAVTPLGWALLLVPFARSSALGALGAAKWMGAMGWALVAAWLGWRIARLGSLRVVGMLSLCLALGLPSAAWAVAGMETGVITALATVALLENRWAIAAAGLAAAWRPELLPWAVTLVVGSTLGRTRSARQAVWALLAVVAPSGLVILMRLGAFGTVGPLSATAKPSDLVHGLFYAAAALLHTGWPMLVLAPWVWRRLSAHQLAILAAFAAHMVSLVLVGGDWMSLFRLAVPVLPSLILVGSSLMVHSASWASALRLALAILVSARLMVAQAPGARRVTLEHAQVMAELGPALRQSERVAALDVGWVGAVTEAAIVDLAGITDPSVAALPGGHTSKRLPPRFLRARGVDRLVIFVKPGASPEGPWQDADFARVVEVLAFRQAREIGYDVMASAPLGSRGRYVVLRLRNSR